MYNHHYGFCARRAMALILLFVLVSQRPYSPYGPLVMNAMEKRNESSSDIPTNIIPFVEDIFRHSEAHDPMALREAPGPATQAVAYALNEVVAQQRKASSIPHRQQQPKRAGGRQHREFAEMHDNDQHRTRLHQHHQHRQTDDPEINFGWYPKSSPLLFSGKKNKVRPREKVSTNHPGRSEAPDIRAQPRAIH